MLFLVAAMAVAGANVPVAKALMAAFEPEQLLVLRFALATAVLLPLAAREPGMKLAALTPAQWGTVAILGIVGSVLFTVFILAGVQRTSGATAGIILATLPAVVALIGIVRGERPQRGELGLIGLAVIGLALVQVPAGLSGTSGSEDTLAGNLLIVCAVMCEAAFVVAARSVSADLPPFRLSLGVAVVSLAACLVFCLPSLGRLDWTGLSVGTWALFVWYTLAASVVCTALWYRGVAHVEVWLAGLATAALPVAALCGAAFGLGEGVSPRQVAGASFVIAAILAGGWARRRAPRT